MANGDVKVKEVRLLESYSTVYNRFMESTIQMTYRFRDLFAQKDNEAQDLERKIQDHLNIAQQKLAHAKTATKHLLKEVGVRMAWNWHTESRRWKNIRLYIRKHKTMQNQPKNSIRRFMESVNV